MFPFVLDKGQLKLVEVTTPLSFLEENARPGNSKLYYGLKFASINSKGEEQGSRMVFGEISLENKQTVSSNGERVVAPLMGEVEVFFRISPASRVQQVAPADRPPAGR